MKGTQRTKRGRRLEGKTDYKARLGILKSEKPRVVVRRTNKYIIGQIIVSEIAQDKVVCGVSSKELLSLGWPEEFKGRLKGRVAAYLTGYYLGKKSKKINEGILDIGMHRHVKKSRIYSFAKGIIESGFKMNCSADALPDDELLLKTETGKLIKDIKEKIDKK